MLNLGSRYEIIFYFFFLFQFVIRVNFPNIVTICLQNLSRLKKDIYKVHLTNEYDEFLGKPGPLRCIFPWSKEPVRVDRRFWEVLVCLDPWKKGWLMDEVNFIQINVSYSTLILFICCCCFLNIFAVMFTAR